MRYGGIGGVAWGMQDLRTPTDQEEPVSAATRTPDQITAEIAETRDRLAATIDQLVYRVQPKTILSRQLASLKAKFVKDDGSLDVATVGKVAGGVVGFVAMVVVVRKVVG
jgi:hypothetical protein